MGNTLENTLPTPAYRHQCHSMIAHHYKSKQGYVDLEYVASTHFSHPAYSVIISLTAPNFTIHVLTGQQDSVSTIQETICILPVRFAKRLMGLSSHISHLGITVTHNSSCIWSCLHAYWPRESVREKKCWHSIHRTSLNEYYTNSITLRGLPFPENCPVNFKPLTQCTFKEPRVGYCRHLLCMFFISTQPVVIH